MATNTTTTNCPTCRLRLNRIGRLVAYRDDAGQHFAFALCERCSSRLTRIPVPTQQKLLNAAVGAIAAHPERYFVRYFISAIEAKLYVSLEAESLARGQVGALLP